MSCPRTDSTISPGGPELRRRLFDALEGLTRSLGTWSERSDDRIEIQTHRHPATIETEPHHEPSGIERLYLTSTIRLAVDVEAERYLPLLARHARRSDPFALLILKDGELHSVRNHRLPGTIGTTIEIAEAVQAIAIQAVKAELLVNEAWHDGLLEARHHLQDVTPGPDVRSLTPPDGRPNALLDIALRIARDGVRRMATTNLTGASKLGPWFVGTEQDELLTDRMEQGWVRKPDPSRHAVTLDAPRDEPSLEALEVRWAHVSSLMGPCMLLAGYARERLGDDAAARLRELNLGTGVRAERDRRGVWLPESWLSDAALPAWANGRWRPGQPAPTRLTGDRATWVTVVPTAWAHPGALARYWIWAEEEARRATGVRSLN